MRRCRVLRELRHVHDPSIASFAHLPRSSLGAVEGAGEIDVELALPVLRGDLQEFGPLLDARVVDEHVQPFELVRVDVEDSDIGPFAGAAHCDRLADALTTTGHDRHLIFEDHLLLPVPRFRVGWGFSDLYRDRCAAAQPSGRRFCG